MNELYGVIGSVHTLVQRKFWDIGLHDTISRDSFDVEFSPTGNVLHETRYTHSEEICGSSFYVYDNADRLIRTIDFDKTETETAITEFEYSPGRRLWTTRDKAGVATRRGVEEYVGTSLVSSSTFSAEERPICLKSLEYAEGKLLKAVSRIFDPDGSLAHVSVTHFDSRGRAVEAFGLEPDGTPSGDGRYRHEYDDEGRLIRVLSYNDFDRTDIPNHVSHYKYKCDEHGNWIERTEKSRFISDEDWIERKTTRKFTYYPLG